MTTIAIDKNYLIAWDSQVTYGNIAAKAHEPKVIERYGRIYAMCGMQCDLATLVDKLESGEKMPPDFEFTLLMITREGTIFTQTEKSLTPVQVSVPHAVGSGSDIAIGAMRAGASAHRAVQIAAELDVYTGGEIFWKNVFEMMGDAKNAAE